jgi:hypothetical protein
MMHGSFRQETLIGHLEAPLLQLGQYDLRFDLFFRHRV